MKLTTKVESPFALGQIIQQGRLQQGLSQRELAKELGTSQKWIWEMEQGKPGILMDRLFQILDAIGVELLAELEIIDDFEDGRRPDASAETEDGSANELLKGTRHGEA